MKKVLNLEIPNEVYEALKRKALKELFSRDDTIIPVVAVQCIINELITGEYTTYENIYTAVEKTEEPVAPPEAKSTKPAVGIPRRDIPAAPKKDFGPPQKIFNNKVTNVYTIWRTLVKTQMNHPKWMAFAIPDVITILRNESGVGMDPKVAAMALSNLMNSGWLHNRKEPVEVNGRKLEGKTRTLYYFSIIGQRWLMAPANQATMLRDGIIDHEVRTMDIERNGDS